jgi:hypothetical protein
MKIGFEIWLHLVSFKYTDVSEVRTSSIIRDTNIALIMEVVCTFETSIYFNETIIFNIFLSHLHFSPLNSSVFYTKIVYAFLNFTITFMLLSKTN